MLTSALDLTGIGFDLLSMCEESCAVYVNVFIFSDSPLCLSSQTHFAWTRVVSTFVTEISNLHKV